jgi:predicted dehydrogenase
MPSDAPVVAVLGQGSIGRRHAQLLLEEGCRVVAFDPSPAIRSTDGVEIAAGEADALASADAAVVASPTAMHLDQAHRALEHGCHLLIEKPLAERAGADVDALVGAARSAGRTLAVAMNLRFHPGPAAVREAVSSGRIGRPLTARFSFGGYLPDWRPGTDYRQSYSARRELGGGVLLDVIHELDYAGWILGPAVEAGAMLGHVSDLELDVEDVVLAHVAYEGGALASFELDYLDRSYRRGCRVVGSEASVEWDWAAGRVAVLGPGEAAEEREAARDFGPTYAAQTRAWLGAVRRGEADLGDAGLVDGAAAAATLRLADAIRESAAAGRRVAVPRG